MFFYLLLDFFYKNYIIQENKIHTNQKTIGYETQKTCSSGTMSSYNSCSHDGI